MAKRRKDKSAKSTTRKSKCADNKRTKKTVTIPKVDVWKFENGKVVEFMEHFDTHTAIMASQD